MTKRAIKYKDGMIDAYTKLVDAKHAENLELYRLMQCITDHSSELPAQFLGEFIEIVGAIQAKAAISAIANNVLLDVLKAALENEKRDALTMEAK